MKKTIGFFVFPNVMLLDVIGPWEVLSTWSRLTDSVQCLMFAETSAPIRSTTGVVFNPDNDMDTLPHLDIVLIPGGPGVSG